MWRAYAVDRLVAFFAGSVALVPPITVKTTQRGEMTSALRWE